MQNLSQRKHRSKSQSRIHSFYWTRRLTRTVCSRRPHFHAALSVQASVFLWLCRTALWAPSGTYSADSEATRSKRNCEVVKGSRAFQEEVFLIFFNFYSACSRGAAMEASGLSPSVLGSLCKIYIFLKNPFSFKTELKMCWFCLYWTLFLNFLGFDHSVCAKPQNKTLEPRNLANVQLQRRWQ